MAYGSITIFVTKRRLFFIILSDFNKIIWWVDSVRRLDMSSTIPRCKVSVETRRYLQRLIVTNPLRESVIQEVIQTLQPALGSHGLDVGCGIGLQAFALVEAVGPQGHVTGMDINQEFLKQAEKLADKVGISKQTTFRHGDLNRLPFEDHTFDWLWSADAAGYPAEEPLSLMRELIRVIKSGGQLALLIYSSQMLLPGYPLLEARLNATSAGIAPFHKGMKPQSHYLRALGWIKSADLKEASVDTFVQSFQAPLTRKIRDALTSLIEMRWEGAESEVSPEVWAEYQRLSRPESPDFILKLPDYYAFFTYSLFRGRVP
jgi:ubiquinone/menaquinone biosynthesis C-methylase UbiE